METARRRVRARELLERSGIADPTVVALKIAGRIVDLHTESEDHSEFEPVRASEKDGLSVIRHSTAHVMADAVQRLFPGTKVTIGPAIENGFYYDFDKPGGAFTDEDLARIESAMREIIAKDSPFRREVVSRETARSVFAEMGETFKVEIIDAIPEGEEISIYKHGAAGEEWFDVCEGPHVPSTAHLGAVKLLNTAGAYWRGDEHNPMLQRIYGTAFATEDELNEHLRLVEEAKRRDHRRLGIELGLFMFDAVAPAMPFFLPRGTYVYNRMIEYIRSLYARHGYDEVITPQLFDPSLFRTSGHLENYNDNMYRVWTEDVLEAAADPSAALHEASFGIKPMNCPSHCVMFKAKKRSYRDLPLRFADFGRLHRYERGGVVHGLSRVRSFSQDDAHIFCTQDDVAGEIERFLLLLFEVYGTFGMQDVRIRFATRPEKRLGSDADWDASERALAEGLERAGLGYTVSPGEGAFYGPKLEFHVQDALKRSWQLGTIQYDANLPVRFDLTYTADDGRETRPVILHRAILGTVERFLSVYIEHCGGDFPVWLAPSQAIALSVSEKSVPYAEEIRANLQAHGLRIDADLGDDRIGAKIRKALPYRYPYMLVVGASEAERRTIALRSRELGDLGEVPFEEFTAKLAREAALPT
jgi:threonyl-tRNA synthetase